MFFEKNNLLNGSYDDKHWNIHAFHFCSTSTTDIEP